MNERHQRRPARDYKHGTAAIEKQGAVIRDWLAAKGYDASPEPTLHPAGRVKRILSRLRRRG
ncbi:hypothetical protein [Actinomadura hibisca]|uniref:hypothetical protein n=1 Tax=Actinomadura hibisca TaxID=68565 RepID=UPI0008379FAE|nr:hypothetical protein [Actinomadura hibisca]